MSITKTSYRINENGVPRIVIDTPKTKNSSRVILHPKALLNVLKKIKKTSNLKYVISTRTGGIVETRAYQRTYERILIKMVLVIKISIHFVILSLLVLSTWE